MRNHLWFVAAAFVSFQCVSANEVVISVTNPSGLQGNMALGFESSQATAFDTSNHGSATVLFDSTANLDAFHIRENGNFLVSAQIGYTIDGVMFEDGEIGGI